MPRVVEMSVVVVSCVGGDALARCIERLPATEVEVVVLLRDAASDPALWARRYPRVRFLPGTDESVAARRKRGVAAATGPLVGIVEDTSWPDGGWCAAAIAAFGDADVAAAAGPVAPASFLSDRCRAFAWIAFGAFAPGSEERLAEEQASANAVAFRRADLLAAMAEDDGLDVAAACRRLRRGGKTIARVDGMAVTYAACSPDDIDLTGRFRCGRAYGEAGPVSHGLAGRIGAVGRALVEPFTLTAAHRQRIRRLDGQSPTLMTMIWLLLLESAWALGIAIGAVAGKARRGR